MSLRILALAASIIVAGCATTANYEKVLSSWVGRHVDHLVSSWGPPYSSYPLSDGGKVLEYTSQRNVQIGGYTYTTPQTTYHTGSANAYGKGGSAYGTYSGTSTTYVQQQTPIQNITKICKTRFTVSPQGIITNWAWHGNDCKAKAPQ